MEIVLQACATLLIYTATLAIVTWTAGALYYDVGRASWTSWMLVMVWVAAVVAVHLI